MTRRAFDDARPPALGWVWRSLAAKLESGMSQGGITKAENVTFGRALCQAATMMRACRRGNALRTWASHVAKRRDRKHATVALAHGIAIMVHPVRDDARP